MKIINNTKVKTVKFADLKKGDVFQSKENGYFYMKTYTICDDYADELNTVHLESGSMHYSACNLDVIPVNCELVIK